MKTSILFIDHALISRACTTEDLKEANPNYTVIEAKDVVVGLKKFQENRVDILFVNMEDEFARILPGVEIFLMDARKRNPELPILAVTGNAAIQEKLYTELGDRNLTFLRKPYLIPHLINKFGFLLNQRRGAGPLSASIMRRAAAAPCVL